MKKPRISYCYACKEWEIEVPEYFASGAPLWLLHFESWSKAISYVLGGLGGKLEEA